MIRNRLSVLCSVLVLGVASSWATVYVPPAVDTQDLVLQGPWRFKASNSLTGCEVADYDDRDWTSVTVPHSYQTLADQTDYSHAWYRIHFSVPEADFGKRLYLRFDGAGITTDVYLNGLYIGQHIGSYTAFTFDITDFVRFGRTRNTLAVRCDSKTPSRIRGNLARPENKPCYYWHVVGGIHRAVHLLKIPVYHIDPREDASKGVYVTTGDVTDVQADLSVRTLLRNSSSLECVFQVKQILCDRAGNILHAWQHDKSAPAATRVESVLGGRVSSPSLWSSASPTLYALHTEVWVDDKLYDSTRTTVGFRDFQMNDEGQFFLNGQRIRLNGASLHSRTEKGFHVYTEADARRDLEAFLDLGFNSVFLSHYPFPQYVYELCNEMGLLAWAENGYVNGSYEEQVGNQITREMIRQYYNHPCIYGWSVGNEIFDKGRPGTETMAAYAQTLDDQRLIMYNHNGSYQNPHADLNTNSTFPGWYRTPTPWDIPHRYINQTGGGCHVAMQQSYLAREKSVDHWEPEGFRQYLVEGLCYQLYDEERFELFYWWQYKDQECRKLRGLINTKGIVSMADYKKDEYYLIKGYNRPEVPILHICGKHWYLRDVSELKVYANQPSVSLSVNGRERGSLANGLYDLDGRKIRHVFFWQDVLEPGRNDIVVRSGRHRDTAVIYYRRTPNEVDAPIRDLVASKAGAFYINTPVQDQYPIHSRFDGSGIHTFDTIPACLQGAGWITTPRQDQSELRTDLSFTAQTDIDVYIMSDIYPSGKVAVSTEQISPSHPGLDAVDGNLETRWTASAGGYPQWIQLNLGTERKLSKIRLAFNRNGDRRYDYHLEVTADGTHWQPLVASTESAAATWTEHSLAPTFARSLRLYISACTPDTGWAALQEIELYEGASLVELQEEPVAETPLWILNNGFEKTDVQGQWRGDDLILRAFRLYHRCYQQGQRVKLETGNSGSDYVVLIKER